MSRSMLNPLTEGFRMAMLQGIAEIEDTDHAIDSRTMDSGRIKNCGQETFSVFTKHPIKKAAKSKSNDAAD